MTIQTDRLTGSTLGAGTKEPVKYVANANVVMNGLQAYAANDRILLIAQDDPIENGIYSVSEGAWSRTKDFDGERDVVQGTPVPHTSGAYFHVTTPSPFVGVTPIEFAFHGGGTHGLGTVLNGTTSIVVTHGLPALPAVGQITITPRTHATNAPGMVWVDGIMLSSFTVNTTSNPGVSGFDFGWSVN